MKSSEQVPAQGKPEQDESLWAHLAFGWNAMWAFRRVNSPYEVKNVPTFSKTDCSFAQSRRTFVIWQLAITATCYIVLDLLALKTRPADTSPFDPTFIPMISRISDVTLSEIKRKALMMAGFGANFYCVVQGAQSICAAVTVAFGLSKVEYWTPTFGSLFDSYSLKNFWG